MYYELDLTASQTKVLKPLTKEQKEEKLSATMQIEETIMTELPIGNILAAVQFVIFVYMTVFGL